MDTPFTHSKSGGVSLHPTSPHRHAICPNCRHDAHFAYIGDQHWPEEVAQKRGIAQVMRLYTCSECGTTVTGRTLDETPRPLVLPILSN
ncbi:MAG: hypothetical protein SF029_05345 [bacterium]|nr:hypothetical protein [bacterium]